jgi:uncharacterized BrkB/YihY/UPF0761 family membrane protein
MARCSNPPWRLCTSLLRMLSSVSWRPLPGAVLAVGCWIALSYLLGLYFRHFANFNKTYGTLGAAVALMTWLYWTGLAMLVGAELNAELAKISSEGKIEERKENSLTVTEHAKNEMLWTTRCMPCARANLNLAKRN